MAAPARTSVRVSVQSASVMSRPSSSTARGRRSFVNITPCPTNTPSSRVTPSQMNVWLEILQRAPITAPRWISTNVPIRESAPTAQPYMFTRSR